MMAGLKTLVRKTLLRPWVASQGAANSTRVALTFDDGPHDQYTPLVLDALRLHGVQATFFLVGAQVRRWPKLLSRIMIEGHEIGNHSMTHAEFRMLSYAGIRREFLEMDQLLRAQGVCQPRIWLRPPKGVLNLGSISFAVANGARYAMWSSDPRDFSATCTADILSHFERQPLLGGDVVLLHDKSAHTVAALHSLIGIARARGLCFATVSALLCSDRQS